MSTLLQPFISYLLTAHGKVLRLTVQTPVEVVMWIKVLFYKTVVFWTAGLFSLKPAKLVTYMYEHKSVYKFQLLNHSIYHDFLFTLTKGTLLLRNYVVFSVKQTVVILWQTLTTKTWMKSGRQPWWMYTHLVFQEEVGVVAE